MQWKRKKNVIGKAQSVMVVVRKGPLETNSEEIARGGARQCECLAHPPALDVCRSLDRAHLKGTFPVSHVLVSSVKRARERASKAQRVEEKRRSIDLSENDNFIGDAFPALFECGFLIAGHKKAGDRLNMVHAAYSLSSTADTYKPSGTLSS